MVISSRRATRLAVVCASIGLVLAAAAQARDDATTVDDQTVVTGLLRGDPAICPSLSASLIESLRAAAGGTTCERALTNVAASRLSGADAVTKEVLHWAHQAAEQAASDNFYRIGKPAWFGGKYTLKALVREMVGTDTGAGPLRVKLGNGPAAARGTPATTVVIDVRKTQPRLLVLYAESDGGTIWSMTARFLVDPVVKRTAIKGVRAPVKSVPPKLFVVEGAAGGSSLVLARTPEIEQFLAGLGLELSGETSGDTDLLLVRNAFGLYERLEFGWAVLPPVEATGPPADRAAFSRQVFDVFRLGNGAGFCALLHPAFKASLGLTPADCKIASTPDAREIPPETLPPPTANGTILAGVSLADATTDLAIDEYVLAVPAPTGYLVSGLFADFLAVIAAERGS